MTNTALTLTGAGTAGAAVRACGGGGGTDNGSLDETEVYHFCAKMGLKLTAAQAAEAVAEMELADMKDGAACSACQPPRARARGGEGGAPLGPSPSPDATPAAAVM
jgi:hypothetical protein